MPHVEGYVGGMQEVIGKIFLNDVTFIATANNKVVDSVMGINLKYMPKNGFVSDFNHGFRPDATFFAYSSSKSPCKDYCFHIKLINSLWF
jgi:hypothetical protein